jgi:GTPase SAR1 family protein
MSNVCAHFYVLILVWLNDIHHYTPDNTPILLVGNKCDLATNRKVSTEQGQQLAEQLGLKFFESSAKTGDGVDTVFHDIAERIVASKVQLTNTEKKVDLKGKTSVSTCPC